MLKHLSIHNYALIAHMELELGEGFTVLTGETGAGKSILLGALALVMGAKADTKTITEGEERCVIEATFVDSAVSGQQSAVSGQEIIIRRELSRNGRSRSFVNDEVVSMAELKSLSTRLIDIHSQHQNLLLGDSGFQTDVVDAIAHNTAERDAYATAYTAFVAADEALRSMQAEADKAQKEADYILFQLKQLKDAGLHSGEEEELDKEEYTLSHAEDIRMHISEAIALLDGDNGSLLQALHGIHLADVSAEIQERIESSYIELKDITDELSHMLSNTVADPQRLAAVQERQMLLQSLKRKFNCRTVDELIAEQERLALQSKRLDSYDEEIARLSAERDKAYALMTTAAEALTRSRQAVCKPVAEHLMSDLSELGIAHANMAVQITPADDYTPSGHDLVDFLFAANLGQTMQRVADVASGGETARIMLTIKALTADTTALPTIIFDEIDTGVSGATATRMGQILKRMGASRQVIAITHLPQIAALGKQHLKVYKQDTDTRTETHISPLNHDERVREIASLMSSGAPTQAALHTAAELLGQG